MGAKRRKSRQGPGHREPSLPPPKPARAPPKPRRKIIAIVLLALTLGGLVTSLFMPGGLLAHRKPVLPSLKLADLDPVVAAAVEEAETAVRDNPDSGATWGKLGQLLFVHGMGAPAAECFSRASELAKDDPRWPYLLGRTLNRENGDAALPHLRRAAAMCKGAPPAPSLLLAELLLERGLLDEAAAQIDLVLPRDPRDARGLLDRARLHVARGQWEAARHDLEASLARAPDVKASHLLLANAHVRAGDAAAATREMQRAAKLSDYQPWSDPFLEEMSSLAIGRSALLERAEMLLNHGDVKPAINALEVLASRYPADVAVQVTLGNAYRQDGQLARAEATFRAAASATVAGQSDAVAARTGLGLTLCEQRRFAEALPPLQECIRLNPNLPEVHFNLATCMLGLGDRAAAIDALRNAVRVEPSFRPGYVALGKALAEAGRTGEAAAQLKLALELDDNDPPTAELLKQLDAAATRPASRP